MYIYVFIHANTGVTIVEASNLPKLDLMRASDPYCLVFLTKWNFSKSHLATQLTISNYFKADFGELCASVPYCIENHCSLLLGNSCPDL